MERKTINAKLAQFLSPEVGASILWFLRVWSLSYLLPNETYYAEVDEFLFNHKPSFAIRLKIITIIIIISIIVIIIINL